MSFLRKIFVGAILILFILCNYCFAINETELSGNSTTIDDSIVDSITENNSENIASSVDSTTSTQTNSLSTSTTISGVTSVSNNSTITNILSIALIVVGILLVFLAIAILIRLH